MGAQLTVEAWADIVIKEWLKKIDKYNIGSTGQLALSFIHHVNTNADGDPTRVEFIFNYYGKFVDWGVGAHVTVQNLEAMQGAGATSRAKKPWFTEVFYVQVKILAEELARKNKEAVTILIKTGVEEALSTQV